MKKAEWLFDAKKKSIFQKNKVKNFKNLEILQSKGDFLNFVLLNFFNNICYIHVSKLKFSTYVLYWEYCRKLKIKQS